MKKEEVNCNLQLTCFLNYWKKNTIIHAAIKEIGKAKSDKMQRTKNSLSKIINIFSCLKFSVLLFLNLIHLLFIERKIAKNIDIIMYPAIII